MYKKIQEKIYQSKTVRMSIGLLFILLFLFFIYLLRNQTPGRSVFYPPCPFYHFTRLYCPGCGTGRALHSLANLEILKAFSFNILTVLLTPFLLFSF
ncbi:MAG TPA: hypothetical protein DHW82_00985, partial [Spirochaetia bacterium]|nr:hypothetical protein [Spirochaetia bacterium]